MLIKQFPSSFFKLGVAYECKRNLQNYSKFMIKNLVNISFILCLVDIKYYRVLLAQIDKLVIVACDECHTQSMPIPCVKLELLLQNVGLDNEQLDTWKIENGHQLFVYPFYTLAFSS